MYKENLFELIRKEEVIIWAGAGLSLYAGYPSGRRLGEILIENLSPLEKDNININLPLPDLAEEFYRLKNNNRNALIKILNQTFLNKEPTSTNCHQSLAIIPHFKTIITTNYDTLIEEAFAQNGQTIYSGKQIPYLENGKTQIFKVHGNLNEPDSVIITKSDYNNFFKKNSENDVFWTVIRERLMTNNVLFLGYNIEDQNVSVIFDRITDALGSNRKECFLVAPNLPQHKISDLVKKGVHYINSTAEDLISELLQNLKDNIISDIEKGKTSADTFRHFLANIDLLPELKADKNSFKVRSIKGTNDNVKGTMNLTLKNDSDFIKELQDFATGKKFGTFEIPQDKFVGADFWYGGLRFPNIEGVVKLELKSNPRVSTSVDIRFDNDFEFNNIAVKLYGSTTIIEIHAELNNANLVAKLDLNTAPSINIKFSYEHNETWKNVKSEIELFTFLRNLAEGRLFTVYMKSGKMFSTSLSQLEPLLDQVNFFLNYFTNLKTIEKHYNLRFSDINIYSVTNTISDRVKLIIDVINGNIIEYDWDDELLITLIDNYPNETVEQLMSINGINSLVVAHHSFEEIIELHGQKINLGFKKVEFIEPFVVNLQSIVERKENEVRLKSRNKKISVSYSKNNIEG